MSISKRGSLQSIILDEIALEGLEGTTLNSLWVYLCKSLNIPHPPPKDFKEKVWKFILSVHRNLDFFELNTERETITTFDRYQCVDSDLGIPLSPEVCPFVRYPVTPICDGNVLGSCHSYKSRKRIPIDVVKDYDVEMVNKTWGNKFIVVASQELRYNALTPENVVCPKDLTSVQYCIWEAIGRSRYNGETTSGDWSLTHFCKDPTIIFYIKNKLIRLGVITHQLFNEKRSDRLIVTTLLTLPRFFPAYQSVLINMVEKLFVILKEKPDFSMPLVDAREYFPSFEKLKTFRKAMLTHVFRNIFETLSVPYSDVYPNSKSKTNANARTIVIVKLRNPEKNIDDIFDNIENVDENGEENTAEDFHNEKHSYVDMPLREEFYRMVSRFGNRGCSQTEIYKHLSIQHLTLRQLLKKMKTEGLVKSYCVDVGRQRTNMYVAAECYDSVNKSQKESLDVLQNLKCAEEPNIPEVEVQFPDVSQINARTKIYDFPRNELFHGLDKRSQRSICRKAFVIQMIDEHCIISLQVLRKLLKQHEKSKGLKDEVCQKSIQRMLFQMSQCKLVRMYEIVLQREENIRIHRYVTHPKIDIDHIVLKNEILKLKNNLYLLLEEKRLKMLNSNRNKNRKGKSLSKSKSGEESKLNKNALIPLKSHKPPKFLISRYMHEFLFYIVVELNECQAPLDITKELLQKWTESEPSLRIDDYFDQLEPEYVNMKAFTKYINWRTFIPPLPRYSDKPAGWVYFIDAVDRMPLSIFNKIFRIDKGADERLTAFLSHPIRQHYLMRQLPSDLQCKISRVQLQRVYISVLKLLNHMGLIQTSECLNVKDPLVMWIYLNRRARALDTTNSEAGYMYINSEREYTPLSFDLRSFDDIHNYWTTLQRICVYTKLGFRSRGSAAKSRSKELNFIGTVDFDEAPLHDSGYQPGDGLGAAGLSTNLFAHTFRNWSWSVHTNNKLSIKNARTGRTVGSGLRGNNKVIRLIHRKTRQPQTVATQLSTSNNKRLKKTAPRDAVDRDALKNMRTLRVIWSKAEDEVLMLGKAASAYVGSPTLCLLAICKACRDVIRRSLGIFNKTTQACCRRLQFMVRKRRHIPQVPTWLHMLQTDDYLQKKYGENFLQRLKKAYTIRSEFCEALAIHYTLIMCYLFKLVHNGYDDKTKTRFLLPDSIQEFHKRFLQRVPIPADEDCILYKNPKTEYDLQAIVIESVLHSTLCSMRDKTLYNLQAFEIYKNYSDELLETAFSKARADGLAVTIKRKNISLLPSHLSGPAYVLSSKYKQKLIYLQIPYEIFDSFYKFFIESLTALFRKPENDNNDAVMELKSPTPGQMFVIGEGLARGVWNVNIKLPINILTVDAEQNQANMSSMDRILDHYQSIFNNAPEQEYTKIIESGQNEKQARVKFHPAHLSYKINYAPFDFISKLPSRYLHFFCALDFLDHEIEINFSKLQREDDDGHIVIECPFKCIFKSEDYISEIERIVEEKKSILNSLTEMAPQKLLNLATSGLSMRVYSSNILTLVRMLESYWYEKESKYERQDLGKYTSNLKRSKSIDWCQICNDILTFSTNSDDFDKTEEYEPTLNKEERLVRAQDVFVVNLPTIQFKISDELKNDKDTICRSKELSIPKRILEPEIARESVLTKVMEESRWNYTSTCLNDLKEKLNELNFSEMEEKHLEEIHNFIESHTLGVSIEDLMAEFPYENFLFKTLHLLSSESIVKRVGISSFMYVHKNHVRPWVVHTFNLKRLDRENIGGSVNAIKRARNQDEDTNCEEDSEIASKRSKTVGDKSNSESRKRTPKPVKRFDPSELEKQSATADIKERDIIAMKPVPWIRLNGSINRRVLDRCLGCILSECIACNGCSAYDICKRFSLFVPVDILFLLEILSDLKCITLIHIEKAETDIFSSYENLKEKPVSFVYDAENTYIKSSGDATMRLSLFIGDKKYTTELI